MLDESGRGDSGRLTVGEDEEVVLAARGNQRYSAAIHERRELLQLLGLHQGVAAAVVGGLSSGVGGGQEAGGGDPEGVKEPHREQDPVYAEAGPAEGPADVGAVKDNGKARGLVLGRGREGLGVRGRGAQGELVGEGVLHDDPPPLPGPGLGAAMAEHEDWR